VTDPAAYARAGEAVVMIHGGLGTRESWMDVAAHVAQSNGQTLVFVPDGGGYGVSRYARRLPKREHASAEGTCEGFLAWLEMIGVRELPMVLAGHSLGGAAILTATDERLGPRTSRVAVGPVFPAADWQQRWTLRISPWFVLALAWLPGMKWLLGKLAFVWSPMARAYALRERQRMHDAFMALPVLTFARGASLYARAKPAPADQLARAVVVLAENDPVSPFQRMCRALERLGFPESQIHRLVAEGHLPHGETEAHPEWTRRNIVEIANIIDHLLMTAREGSVLSTHVASTMMSGGGSSTSQGSTPLKA
jgi:pimeloyl-ACP methyl ester carboxylesterase